MRLRYTGSDKVRGNFGGTIKTVEKGDEFEVENREAAEELRARDDFEEVKKPVEAKPKSKQEQKEEE